MFNEWLNPLIQIDFFFNCEIWGSCHFYVLLPFFFYVLFPSLFPPFPCMSFKNSSCQYEIRGCGGENPTCKIFHMVMSSNLRSRFLSQGKSAPWSFWDCLLFVYLFQDLESSLFLKWILWVWRPNISTNCRANGDNSWGWEGSH